jgi:hypothetical protein
VSTRMLRRYSGSAHPAVETSTQSVEANSKRLLQGNGLHTFRMAVELPYDLVPGMRLSPNTNHRWAVVLAGGDATRLQELTYRGSGDARPKQFCHFFGGKSLLGHTRERIGPLFRG